MNSSAEPWDAALAGASGAAALVMDGDETSEAGAAVAAAGTPETGGVAGAVGAVEEKQRKRRIACQATNVHRALWPELRTTKVTHAWTGNVAFTFDFTPHIAVNDGIHYAAGCQGSGVAMATWLGHQAALQIAKRANRPSAFFGLDFPTMPTYSGNPWFLPIVGTAYRFQDWLDRRAG